MHPNMSKSCPQLNDGDNQPRSFLLSAGLFALWAGLFAIAFIALP